MVELHNVTLVARNRSDDIPDFLEMKKALDSYEEKIRKDKASLKVQEEELMKRKEMVEADIASKEEKSRAMMEAEKVELMRETEESRNKVEAEKKGWEEEKERVQQTKVFEKVITLNVGGTRYTTTLSTLTKYPDSMLGVMFSGRHDLPQQEDGSYFIDRDGEVFKYVLMYLRDRDLCFDYLHDDQLCNLQGQLYNGEVYNIQGLPSPLERSLLKLVAYEAQYFQLSELETKARIVLNPNRGQFQTAFSFSAHQKHNGYGYAYSPDPHSYSLDYVQDELQCAQFINWATAFKHHVIKVACDGQTGSEMTQKVTFDSCDLSGVTFSNCYFHEGVSFEGCILHGTKFERVGGLVRHKVHFAPWQVAQADFEPKLLQALKDNGCIY